MLSCSAIDHFRPLTDNTVVISSYELHREVALGELVIHEEHTDGALSLP